MTCPAPHPSGGEGRELQAAVLGISLAAVLANPAW